MADDEAHDPGTLATAAEHLRRIMNRLDEIRVELQHWASAAAAAPGVDTWTGASNDERLLRLLHQLENCRHELKVLLSERRS